MTPEEKYAEEIEQTYREGHKLNKSHFEDEIESRDLNKSDLVIALANRGLLSPNKMTDDEYLIYLFS